MTGDDPNKGRSSKQGTSDQPQQLDLTSVVGFDQATEWIQWNVVIKPDSSIRELDVRVASMTPSSKERRASIFLDCEDG